MATSKQHRLPAEAHESHKMKMSFKAARRAHWHAQAQANPARILPASTNRRTGKPHEHKREIARRLRQEART